jgi:hypothetical protein
MRCTATASYGATTRATSGLSVGLKCEAGMGACVRRETWRVAGRMVGERARGRRGSLCRLGAEGGSVLVVSLQFLTAFTISDFLHTPIKPRQKPSSLSVPPSISPLAHPPRPSKSTNPPNPKETLALTETSYFTIRILQTFSVLENRDSEPFEEGLGVVFNSARGVKIGLMR